MVPRIFSDESKYFPCQFQTLSKKRQKLSPPVKAPSLEDCDDYDETLLASAASGVAMAMGMAAAPSTAPNNNILIPFLNGDQKDVEEDIRNLLNIADIPLPGKEIPVVRIQIQFHIQILCLARYSLSCGLK